MECDLSSLPGSHPDWETHVFEDILTPQSIGSDADGRSSYEDQLHRKLFVIGTELRFSPQSGLSFANDAKPATFTDVKDLPRSDTTGGGRCLDCSRPENVAQFNWQAHVQSDRSTPAIPSQEHAEPTLEHFSGTNRACMETGAPLDSVFQRPPDISLKVKASADFMTRTPPKISSVSEAPPRIKSSIPSFLSAEEYTRQCTLAAYSSRLNPFAMHSGEEAILSSRITNLQIVPYLNIRNGILRLWTRNPLVTVTIEEAFGCAKDVRYFALARFAHEWLVRQGYINFGCVETFGLQPVKRKRGQLAKPRTIVIVGAGISGLTCARQLEALFRQFEHRLVAVRRENMPRIVLLEGRTRIGGRVYSRRLRTQVEGSLPQDLRNTAEMGAQIITGFEHGNPLNIVIRGQLALDCHSLKDDLVLCDFDGVPINERQDDKIQRLYNEILECANAYSWEPSRRAFTEGPKPWFEYAEKCRYLGKPSDIFPERGTSEDAKVSNFGSSTTVSKLSSPVLTKESQCMYTNGANSDHLTVTSQLGCSSNLNYDGQNVGPCTTLGALMDKLVAEHQLSSGLSPQEMRLLNWHYANLEYSNAVNVDQLSLGGWDQDGGNEFDGPHAEVIGGYSQVAQGLALYPSPLNIRFGKEVKHVQYSQHCGDSRRPSKVICRDGEIIEADYVVVTLPLGVLKSGNVSFEPPLPASKLGALDRLGFGLLNKIILVFDQIFWEKDRDMFGMLNQTRVGDSLKQEDYVSRRGMFYLFWNRVKTSGRPMLVALMAGEAAHEAEQTPDQILIEEVTAKLAKAFSLPARPIPCEAIVTRWKKDPFSLGTYSYLGPDAKPGDYDRMADPIGNLHFAGEATCGSHPATVHGALLSGLRVASEVTESILGSIPPPDPLIGPSPRKDPAL